MAQAPVTARYPSAHLILLVIAIVFFVLYMLVGFGTITSSHGGGFLGAGLVAFAASFL